MHSSTVWGDATPSTSGGLRSTARRSRQKGGCADRAEPNGSGQAGLEAPHPHRCQRHPARGSPDGRQRARQHDAGRAGRCGTADPPALGQAPQATQQAARRQGLRSPPLPPNPDPPRHPTPHRTPRHREQRQAGSAPVGRRAHPVLVRPVSPAIRYERRADIHTAFLTLASAIIAWRFVQR